MPWRAVRHCRKIQDTNSEEHTYASPRPQHPAPSRRRRQSSRKFQVQPVRVRARLYDVADRALRGLRRQQLRLVHLSGGPPCGPVGVARAALDGIPLS